MTPTHDLNAILTACATAFHVHPEEIKGRSRQYHITPARHAFFYVASTTTTLTATDIARWLGNRVPSTAFYAARTAAALRDTDPWFASRLRKVAPR